MKVSVFLAFAALAAIAGCGSSTSIVTSPGSTRCGVTVAGGAAIPAGGGTGAVTVTTARECQWTASSDAPWLTIMSTPSGQGDGTVQYSATSNPVPSARRGNIVVGEARAEVTQAAAPCQFAVTPPSFTLDAAGGDRSATIQTVEGCSWTAASGAGWISIVGTQNPNGPGSVTFHVDANGGEPRTGSLVVAGQSIQVSQGSAATPCTYALDPASATVEAVGGTTRFAVAARAGCGWTAVSEVPWIQISGDAVGTGNGNVTLIVAANTGAARSATVMLQDRPFTVVQAAAATPCSYAIAPPSVSIGAEGGQSSVNVTTQTSCTWTAASQVPWIFVSSGATGSGNGSVALTIAVNTGPARNGTVSIAGSTFTVTQAASTPACAYSIAPESFAAPAAASTTGVDVTTQSGCGWTAVSQAAWITVTTGATGTGNGRVELAIAANTGAARAGTVTIAGRTYTVNQAAPTPACAYSIAPDSFAAPAAAHATGVDVTTQSGCAWTAVSQAAWITVTAGASGSGNGRVELAIAANTGPARAGTVTIAGRTYTVTQAAVAAPCTYTLVPTSFTAPREGGSTFVDVATQSGCAWTAVSNDAWIAVTEGASGSGTGRVGLTVGGNVDGVRTGSLTIAGQTFSVHQPAAPRPCTYTIAPATFIAPAAGAATEVTVTTDASCVWTATSQVSWITITSGATGTGAGRVQLAIAVNAAAARTGTVIIGGQTYVVSQEGIVVGVSSVLQNP